MANRKPVSKTIKTIRGDAWIQNTPYFFYGSESKTKDNKIWVRSLAKSAYVKVIPYNYSSTGNPSWYHTANVTISGKKHRALISKISNKEYICISDTVTDTGSKRTFCQEVRVNYEEKKKDETKSVGEQQTSNEETLADTGSTADIAAPQEENIEGIMKASEGYRIDIEELKELDTIYEIASDGSDFFNLRSVLGVFGLPYQFLPIADPRIADAEMLDSNQIKKFGFTDATDYSTFTDTNSAYGDTLGIGEVFADKIMASMPILFMCPGKPSFMGQYTKEEREDFVGWLISKANLTNKLDSFEDLLENSGKYYTFEPAIDEYYKYVNPMCRIAAAYMNVYAATLDGTRLENLNWAKFTESKSKGLFTANGLGPDNLYIPFYIESETQIQDSFGNASSDSTLASAVNQISDYARELQFLIGNVGAATDIKIFDQLTGDADISTNADNLKASLDKILGGNNFLGNIKNHLISVATGGKMIFPKIWSGSDYNRSYNVTIKLRSPDRDNLSLYFNIIAPIMHLVGFVAPHMIEADPNSYGNPFLVRALYKGFFNIDMGLITSMDISRGDQGNWTADGIPATVDVSFTITDLYEIMAITKTDADDWRFSTVNNTAQMDYIANFCGVNVYAPEIKRNIRMWFVNMAPNRVRDFFSINIYKRAEQSIITSITNVFQPKRWK